LLLKLNASSRMPTRKAIASNIATSAPNIFYWDSSGRTVRWLLKFSTSVDCA
jgi:hypothetical protein